ncbi:transcriptional regulator, TetR family [Gottschalkia purinilytica]|uniref:Transcriptional regulator, TetR family n=1 Tax=Gottschalkia purinilytica TaxID=1503 RepID=A0A0L0WBX1_GOTPU|nr:TetR/AcrR family transcriptional regulator [Gottschalkia purinilytica]KNF08961.1 transcriptional regulator, TetR family [Gottschalkia purinilytica]
MKSFTVQERRRIRRELISKGRELFKKYGLKKTSINMLTKSVGISTGAFYKFFNHKEELLLNIFDEEEKKFRKKILLEAKKINDRDIKKFKEFFKIAFQIAINSLMFNNVKSKDLELAAKVIEKESLDNLYKQDYDFAQEIIEVWKQKDLIIKVDSTIMFAMIRAIVCAILSEENFSDDKEEEVIDMICEMLSKYLVKT